MKFNYGFKSRSCRVVQDSSVAVAAAGGGAEEGEMEEELRLVKEEEDEDERCWGNLPEELLREVLMRIEGSEISWPPRKNVVGCATVCRSWREIMKQIVKTPELSGLLTFPISLKQSSQIVIVIFK